MFTGDDYNYVDLIAGDGERHSDALLGAFAAVAPNASAAIQALDARRPGRVPADPRPDRGAGPARLRRAHLLLQDRRGLPVLAQRPPAGVHHGRRPALGAQPAAPVHAGAAGRPGRRAGGPRPGRRALERLLAMHGARRGGGCRHERAPPAVAEPGDDQVRRTWPPRCGCTAEAGITSIGLWREPVAEVGLAAAEQLVADSGLRVSSRCAAAASSPQPTRRPRRAALDENRRAIDETAALARPARPARRRCWCWSPAGCPTATGTCPVRGSAPGDAVGALVDDAVARRRRRWPSSRCTRSTPPTGG